MTIRPPGRAPTRLEQIQLSEMLKSKNTCGTYEKVFIHHITENTPYKLQLEVERRIKVFRPMGIELTFIKFERVYL